MSRKVIITTPFPSLAETARILGVSVARVKRIQRLLSEKRPRGQAKAEAPQPILSNAQTKTSNKG